MKLDFSSLKKQFDWVSQFFEQADWQHSSETEDETTSIDRMELVVPETGITIKEAMNQSQKEGMRHANVEELLAYAKANPEEQRKYCIYALGSSALHVDGRRYVTMLDAVGRDRFLGGSWVGRELDGRVRLLLVRKLSSPRTLEPSALLMTQEQYDLERMPLSPERKILDLAKYTRLLAYSLALARARSFDNGFSASDLLDWMVESLQERADMLEVGTAEAIKPHPQETREEEWWEENPKYMAIVAGMSSCKVYNIPAIIQEAERRERERLRENFFQAVADEDNTWRVKRHWDLLITPPTP